MEIVTDTEKSKYFFGDVTNNQNSKIQVLNGLDKFAGLMNSKFGTDSQKNDSQKNKCIWKLFYKEANKNSKVFEWKTFCGKSYNDITQDRICPNCNGIIIIKNDE